MKAKFCPKCKSTQINMVAGGQIGLWECANCNFKGSIFPEKQIEELKEKKKKSKTK